MPKIMHINPDTFLIDSFRLGRLIYDSGFRPKHVVSIWRGGTPVGLGVDSYFRQQGIHLNHSTIATASYTGIQQQGDVIVKNLEHLVRVICEEDGLLFIDDVLESGKTITKIIELLRAKARSNAPKDIRVAALHHKPAKYGVSPAKLYSLNEVDESVWIDYPHEIAELVDDSDPTDQRIMEKDPQLVEILHGREPTQDSSDRDLLLPSYESDSQIYLSSRQLLHDSVRLGMKMVADQSWQPDVIVALWQGGVWSGLPIHEVYKYMIAKGRMKGSVPDHISVNTAPTRDSTRPTVVGLNYLEERVNRSDRVLIIDTTFRSGSVVNALVTQLKESLRRNLDESAIRVASVYYNKSDKSTLSQARFVEKPDYYLKEVTKEIVYPHNVHKLPQGANTLQLIWPELSAVFNT